MWAKLLNEDAVDGISAQFGIPQCHTPANLGTRRSPLKLAGVCPMLRMSPPRAGRGLTAVPSVVSDSVLVI